jgi:hypothetical protein
VDGKKPVSGPVYSEGIRERAFTLREEGKNATEVARIIGGGLNATTVRNWFRSKDQGFTPRTQRGPKSFDHTGITYGDLTVIKLAGRVPQYGEKKDSGETIPLWELKCSCGKTIHQTGIVLNQYKKKKRLLDKGEGNPAWRMDCDENPVHVMPCKVGDTLGDLEVLAFPPNEGQCGDALIDRWIIACSCKACRKYDSVNPYFLTISNWRWRVKRLQDDPRVPCACGCKKGFKHGLAARQKDGRHERYEYTIWNNANRRAKDTDVPFTITPQDVVEIGIPEVCPVLGIPLEIPSGDGFGQRTEHSPSLDKFIPSLGYIKGNIHIISWRANRLKNNGTPEDWIKIAAWCQQEEIKRKMRQSDS